MHESPFFYVILLIGLFVAWATTGGPTRPISFAGAYITPITNEGQTQTGYGPKLGLGETISAGGTASVPGAPSSTPGPTAISYTSPYQGLVRLEHTAKRAAGTFVTEGYVQIFVSPAAGKSVDVTGWKITNSSGSSATIPNGILIMHLGTGNTLQDVLLRPGDVASLSNETSPIGASFEVNKCAGYLNTTQSSYNPCVYGHVSDPKFLTGTWYVYLAKSPALWRSAGDTLTLYDAEGKSVTSLTY
jgi:hypothetical protein